MRYLLLFVIALTIISCDKKEKADYAVLTGTIESIHAENVVVRGFNFTKEIEVKDNMFSDTLYIENDGFYHLFIDRVGTEIYLEKGKNLEVNYDIQRVEETFSFEDDLKEENKFLFEREQWSRENLNVQTLFSLDEEEFKTAVKAHQDELQKILDSHEISDRNFKEKVEAEFDYFGVIMTESYENAHRYFTQNPEFNVSDNFYDSTKNFKFNDVDAYTDSSTYRDVVMAHYNRLADEKEEKDGENYALAFMKLVDADFPNGPVKEDLFNQHLQYGLAPTAEMSEVFEIYKNSEPDSENLASHSERYEMLLNLMPGKTSPNFENFENYKGGEVSLKDLEGKYVYIDVWATWCGPCLQEIPFLKEVEKDYENKNIQIVSMSIDVEKDYDKWRDMIEKENLGGLQILADKNWESSFVQEYGIRGIPRFILLDPEGNIVSADAPRPSDPKLRTMLDELL